MMDEQELRRAKSQLDKLAHNGFRQAMPGFRKQQFRAVQQRSDLAHMPYVPRKHDAQVIHLDEKAEAARCAGRLRENRLRKRSGRPAPSSRRWESGTEIPPL